MREAQSMQMPVRARPSAPRQEQVAPDSYLTDGQRLLRVVSRFEAGPGGTFASLEDCLTLEVRPYSAGELDSMRLIEVQEPVRWGA